MVWIFVCLPEYMYVHVYSHVHIYISIPQIELDSSHLFLNVFMQQGSCIWLVGSPEVSVTIIQEVGYCESFFFTMSIFVTVSAC